MGHNAPSGGPRAGRVAGGDISLRRPLRAAPVPPPSRVVSPPSFALSLSLAVSGSCIAHRHIRHPDGHTPAERAGGRRAGQAAGQGRRRRGEQHFFSDRREKKSLVHEKTREADRCSFSVHTDARSHTRRHTRRSPSSHHGPGPGRRRQGTSPAAWTKWRERE